ncbi:MAG: hypothetical protein ACP5IG_03655 [Candidatus Micrarchaeia archaeon]
MVSRLLLELTALTGLALVALNAASLVFTPFTEEQAMVLTDASAVVLAFLLTATMGFLYFNEREEETKKMRLFFFLFSACWLAAESTWMAYEVFLATKIPTPSLADFFWLAGYAFLALATILVFKAFYVKLHWRSALIATACGALAITAFYAFHLQQLLLHPLTLETIINAAYPFLDVFIVSAAAYTLLAGNLGGWGRALATACAALIFLALADALYAIQFTAGTYEWGELADLVYDFSYLTFLCAGLLAIVKAEKIKETTKQFK